MFAAWLLISIMLSTLTIPIGILQVSGTGVFMIATAYFFISRLANKPVIIHVVIFFYFNVSNRVFSFI